MGSHESVINRVARERLAPIGVVRQGRSRVWLDDHGWWVGMIEFQPLSGRRGTTLNAAVHWLWSCSGHLSFDEPLDGRVRRGPFVEYSTTAPFESAVATFVDDAAALVGAFRAGLASLPAAVESVGASYRGHMVPGRTPCWRTFHTAVLAGLSGDLERAHALFGEVIGTDASSEIPWQIARRERARHLRDLTVAGDGRARLVSEVEAAIHVQRSALKLPAMTHIPWEDAG